MNYELRIWNYESGMGTEVQDSVCTEGCQIGWKMQPVAQSAKLAGRNGNPESLPYSRYIIHWQPKGMWALGNVRLFKRV